MVSGEEVRRGVKLVPVWPSDTTSPGVATCTPWLKLRVTSWSSTHYRYYSTLTISKFCSIECFFFMILKNRMKKRTKYY
jgi:hypothetical protein